MNLVALRNAVTSRIGRQALTLQKHGPTILFGAGVIGVVATAVLASRATLKLNDILDEHAESMEKIDAAESIVEFTEDKAQRARTLVYMRTIGNVTKLYAPAIGIGVASIWALTGSHVMLTRRNAAVMASYAALDKSYRAYRDKVIEKYGSDQDEEFRYGEFDKELVQTKDGPVTLGFERTGAGAVVGWLRGAGDSFVDFGLFSQDQSPQLRLFVNGGEPSVLLDFNVCGVIYDKI
jgi:hypothetical protein